MKLNFLISNLLISTFSISVSIYAAGTNSAEFLMMGHGARAEGLSGAYTALCNDSNSIYWNTAGLSGIKQTEVSFTYNSWIADISQQYIAAGLPLSGGSAIGFGVEYIDLGGFTGRRSQTSAPYNFKAGDVIVNIGFAGRVSEGFSAGFSVKFLQESIEDVKAEGIIFDFGIQKMVGGRIKIGAALQNAGADIRFVSRSEKLPVALNLGAAYSIGAVQFGVDVKRRLNSQETEINFGTEFVPLNILNLRCGLLKTGYNGAGMQYKFSGGFGLKLGKNTVDYAFSPAADFGITHKASLSVKF